MPDIILIELITESAVAVVTALLMVGGSFQSVFMFCVCVVFSPACRCRRRLTCSLSTSFFFTSTLSILAGVGVGGPKVVPGSFPEGTF